MNGLTNSSLSQRSNRVKIYIKLIYITAEVLYYLGYKFDWKWASDKAEYLDEKYQLEDK